MPLEGVVLHWEVDAEVRSTALLTGVRALGNEPGEQMRCRLQPLETSRIAYQAAVFPEPVTEVGGHSLRR